MAATYPADTFQEGVDLTIEASNQLAQVVRGDANTEVTVADGSTIPSIRKAQADSMYFKEPELWVTGQTETDYLQLKKYIDPTTNKESWWFAKGAMVSNPVAMGTSPFGDDNWTLYTPEDLFISGKAEYESIYQALKGKAAEAGYNLVRGSFEEGGTLTNTNDVLWYQSNGRYYSWAGTFPKVVAAGSTPATSGGIGAGAWVDRTDVALRPSVIEALRRSYAEAGYNLVNGSFEAGGTLVNANDVLLQERTGKAFSGPAGTVPAGTNPASGGFVDKSGGLLRHELATSNGATKVGTSDGGSVQDFIDNIDQVHTRTFANVDAMLAFDGLIEGQQVEWQGYYTPNDGGGNTGIVKVGAHTPDGGSIFSVDANTYIEARFDESSIDVASFGGIDGSDISSALSAMAGYLRDTLTNLGKTITGNGNYNLSSQVDLSNVNVYMPNAIVKLTANFPASPAIIVQRGGGNNASNRVFEMVVDGNVDNQTSTIIDDNFGTTTKRTMFELRQQNYLGATTTLIIFNAQHGVLTTGNTEGQVINVRGVNVERLVTERLVDIHTPDENTYNIHANGCNQIFVQGDDNIQTSATINIQAEGCGNDDSPTVLVKTNKYLKLSGFARGNTGTFLNVIAGNSSVINLDLDLYYNLSLVDPVIIDSCGSLNGRLSTTVTAFGGCHIKKSMWGGIFEMVSQDTAAGIPLRLGVDANTRVNKMNITISSVDSALDVDADLSVLYAFECDITINSGTSGVIVAAQYDTSFSIPSNYITANLPFTTTDQNIAGVTARGAHTTTELTAYSTPVRSMKAYNRTLGLECFYTNAWQKPTFVVM